MPAGLRQTIRVKFNRGGTGINSARHAALVDENRVTFPEELLHDDCECPSFHCG
jgi:hypothetical protein